MKGAQVFHKIFGNYRKNHAIFLDLMVGISIDISYVD